MNSPHRQAEIKALINQIKEKQEQFDQARKDDVVFNEIKNLYFELKLLNNRLKKVLDEVNLKPL